MGDTVKYLGIKKRNRWVHLPLHKDCRFFVTWVGDVRLRHIPHLTEVVLQLTDPFERDVLPAVQSGSVLLLNPQMLCPNVCQHLILEIISCLFENEIGEQCLHVLHKMFPQLVDYTSHDVR